MTVTFYNNSSDREVVLKPLSNGSTFIGEPVNPISFKNPTIRFKMDNIPNYNYAYISDLSRYYYITDKTCGADGIWDITFLRDPLMSFSSEMLLLPAKIARNASDYNSYIPDNKIIQKSNKTIEELPVSIVIGTGQGYLPWLSINEWTTATSTKHFRIGVSCFSYTSLGQTLYPNFGRMNFWGTNTTMARISQRILATQSDPDTNIIGFLYSDLNMDDFLHYCAYMPIAPSSSDVVTNIRFQKSWLGTITGNKSVFDHTIDMSQDNLATDSSITHLKHTYKSAWKISVPRLFSSVHSYLNCYPYTQAKIKFQPFGEVTFDISKYMNDESIYFEVEEDSVTGDAVLYIRGCPEDGNNPVLGPKEILAESNVKVDFPTYSLFNESLSKVANLGNIVSNVSGLAFGGLRLAAGDPTGAFSIGGSIGNVIKDGLDLVSSGAPVATKGSNGSQLQDQIPIVTLIQNEYTYPNSSLEGLPLHETRTLSNVHGYTEIEKIELDGLSTALPDEIDEIRTMLYNGVILP